MAKKMDKIVTPEFRVSFPEVFKSKSFQGGASKFSVVALFDAKADIQSLKDLAKRAMAIKYPDGAIPKCADGTRRSIH